MEILTLIFQYTQSEYVKADRQYLILSKMITKTSVIISAVCLLLAPVCLFLSSFAAWSIIFLIVTIILVFFECFVYFCIPGVKFRKTAKYHDEYILTFSQNGIRFKTKNMESDLKWSVYTDFWENDDFYYLIQKPWFYSLIPKRAFETKEDQEKFEEIVLTGMMSAGTVQQSRFERRD